MSCASAGMPPHGLEGKEGWWIAYAVINTVGIILCLVVLIAIGKLRVSNRGKFFRCSYLFVSICLPLALRFVTRAITLWAGYVWRVRSCLRRAWCNAS